MVPVPGRIVPKRLRGLQVLSPREAFLASVKQRLAKPWRNARRSLAARIGLAAIAMTGLLVVLGVTVSAAMFALAARQDRSRILSEAALASAEVTASIGDSRYHASRYAAGGAQREIDRAHATLERAKGRLATVRQRSADIDGQAREAMEWLQYQVEGFERELTALERSVATYGPSASGNALAEAIEVSGEQLAEQARGVESRLSKASGDTAAELAALNKRLALIVIGLLALGIAVTIAGARLVTRTTAGSIREITVAMSSLAAGDRSVVLPGTGRQDEIGEMARALLVFRKDAEDLAHFQEQAAEAARQELLRQEAEHARDERERERKAKLLRELAQRLERTVGEVVSGVAAASEQLQATASSMAASATQSARFTGEVARSMKNTAAGVTAAASASDQFAMSITEISRLASGSACLAEEARRSVQSADETIADLATAAEQVGQVVGMIDGIAQRTTLLALNASIEAARSGEVGRGFAVVAGEVKELAGQTSKATGEVAEQIKAIQGSTDASVAALRRIAEQVHQMEGSAVAIAQAVDEQTLASRDLARNLTLAAGGTDQIERGMSEVTQLTHSTGAAASQLLDAAGELHRQAMSLRTQVDEFLGYVQAA